MKLKASKLLLIIAFTLFSAQNIKASNPFFDALGKLCLENKIDLEKIKTFFSDKNINLNEAFDPQLYINIFNWRNAPYRLGGKTQKGIDCSNYVFQLNSECQSDYATSYQLAKITNYIDPSDLQEGDLVFFNVNGGGISHVGIYLQDGKFTHSSSSNGVIISSMDEPYWSKRFCRAGRISSNK
ncbi:MAG: C40 family peptidase [Chitinophagales bacterium]|jgi:murein DD-endopeptidase / murein LD-carboxypeptidase|nr:C40 family peptidase [Bacteroidota bacterium]MCB9075275.1 C40 family peptidase [Chitinophagales bacterium]